MAGFMQTISWAVLAILVALPATVCGDDPAVSVMINIGTSLGVSVVAADAMATTYSVMYTLTCDRGCPSPLPSTLVMLDIIQGPSTAGLLQTRTGLTDPSYALTETAACVLTPSLSTGTCVDSETIRSNGTTSTTVSTASFDLDFSYVIMTVTAGQDKLLPSSTPQPSHVSTPSGSHPSTSASSTGPLSSIGPSSTSTSSSNSFTAGGSRPTSPVYTGAATGYDIGYLPRTLAALVAIMEFHWL